MDEFTLKLSSPITDEQWDAITEQNTEKESSLSKWCGVRIVEGVEFIKVVRCKDCRWWSEKLWACTDRGHGLASSDPDFYCADGERKGGDEE